MEIFRQKNVATRIVFPIVDADGDFVTGASSLDSEIDTFADGSNPDGFTDCTNEATEIGTTGIYYLNLTQSEMNNDYIVVQVKTGTAGAKTQMILIQTIVGDVSLLATTDDGGAINVASGIVEAQVKSIDNNAITASSIASDAITAAKIATGAIDADAIADNAIDAGAIAADAITAAKIADNAIDAGAIASNAITSAKIASGAITSSTFAAGAIDAAAIAANAIGASELASDAVAEIVDAVWDEDIVAAHTTADTAGKLLNDVEAAVDTEIAAIKAKTDNLPSDPADASDIASSFTTVNTKLDTIDDFLDTEIAAIKAKTDNLPADPADASDIASSFTTVNTKLDTIDDFLDTEVAAIKAKTDSLTFSTANRVDAQVFGMENNTVTATAIATDAIDADAIAANAIGSSELAASAVNEIADQVWEEAIADHSGTAGSTAEALDNAGGGASPSAIADAVWDERIDDHLSDRSFGMKIGIYLPFVAPDFDYRKIKEIVSEITAKIETLPQPEKVDLVPISEGLQAVIQEIRDLPRPKDPEKMDYSPITNKLDGLMKQVKAIEIPEQQEVDLTPVIDRIEQMPDNITEVANQLETIIGRIREFFSQDVEDIKTEVAKLNKEFKKIPAVMMAPREEDND
jgi:hypothetical protein